MMQNEYCDTCKRGSCCDSEKLRKQIDSIFSRQISDIKQDVEDRIRKADLLLAKVEKGNLLGYKAMINTGGVDYYFNDENQCVTVASIVVKKFRNEAQEGNMISRSDGRNDTVLGYVTVCEDAKRFLELSCDYKF